MLYARTPTKWIAKKPDVIGRKARYRRHFQKEETQPTNSKIVNKIPSQSLSCLPSIPVKEGNHTLIPRPAPARNTASSIPNETGYVTTNLFRLICDRLLSLRMPMAAQFEVSHLEL